MTKNDKLLIITLRAARTNRGLTLVDVAGITPYSRDQIHKFELDSSNIPYPMLEELLSLYEIPLKNIFLGVESDFIGKFEGVSKTTESEEMCS